MNKIRIEKLTKVFSPHPEPALKLLAQGLPKDEIFKRTGLAIGLQDVNFTVNEGEILVVMGLSGSGKSTLIRCVNRLIEPTSGKIEIDGTDVTALSHADLVELRRHKFGMVFQNFALFPHRSILQNVAYGLEIQKQDPAVREAKAFESLELVGLKGWEQAYPHQLSGGMQQRVGLARALAVDPDILLMDEAFSALDPLIRRDMQHELIDLQSRVQKTILFITHDLDEALKLGNRIVLMKDGAIVQIGSGEEILNNPANDYVERFIEDVDKTQVLTAASVMIKAHTVAFPDDGPRTVLRKMHEESFSSLYVVRRDYTLEGLVWGDDAARAIEKGEHTISGIIDKDLITAAPDETLGSLINKLAGMNTALPVVNEQQKLLGMVIKGSVLWALSERGGGYGTDT